MIHCVDFFLFVYAISTVRTIFVVLSSNEIQQRYKKFLYNFIYLQRAFFSSYPRYKFVSTAWWKIWRKENCPKCVAKKLEIKLRSVKVELI